MKRFHDAGKTGWITIAMVVLAIIASMVLGMLLPPLFGVNMAQLQADMQAEMQDVISSNDPSAAMSVAMEQARKVSQAQLLPSIVNTAVVTGILGFVMSLFKSDPNDNQYGAAPGGAQDSFV